MMKEYVCLAVPRIEADTGLVHTDYIRNERIVRIVRCRDCEHAECYESELTGSFILCSHFKSEGCKAMVEPDGFCSWGEEREKQ